MKWILIFLFCFFVSGFSSDAEKALITFSSPKPFSSEEIFSRLDSIGNNAHWMEWDRRAIQDSALFPYFLNEKVSAAWFLPDSPQSGMLAVLSPHQKGERFSFYRIKNFNPKVQKLALHTPLDESRIFRDFRKVRENEFEHLDNSALRVYLSESRIRFEYRRPDTDALRLPTSFISLQTHEKKEIVDDYLAFCKNEYAVMVRAFVQSTRDIFNWQAWHWYLPEWIKNYFIGTQELEAVLSSSGMEPEFRIFSARTENGEIVTLKTDGNGNYTMELYKP